jgi:hypothetical protein
VKRKIIESFNSFNWGKFMILQFTEEDWRIQSAVDNGAMLPRRDRQHVCWLNLWPLALMDDHTDAVTYIVKQRPAGAAWYQPARHGSRHDSWHTPKCTWRVPPGSVSRALPSTVSTAGLSGTGPDGGSEVTRDTCRNHTGSTCRPCV